jgi:hypothetical protein
MNKTELLSKVTRTFHKVGFQLKKHSPEILAAVGTVGTVASAVWACKQTTKLQGIVEDGKAQIAQFHEAIENPEILPAGAVYTEEDMKKDLTLTYVQTGIKVVRLYAGPVILGTLSLTAMLTSNNILRKRNVALAAAYTAVDKGFKEYRSRVVERFGEEIDKELRYNIKAKEVEETVVNEDGTETTVVKTVEAIDPNAISEYSVIFYEGCNGWTKDPELNKCFLIQQQNYANDLLKNRGYLFLNEVYDMLGVNRTKAGQVVGWWYDEEHPTGDNFVDFGIFDINDKKKCQFINGDERSILLDFNVDGPIINYM